MSLAIRYRTDAAPAVEARVSIEIRPESSVAVMAALQGRSPDEMAKELFTHRGSGTLVRRGERIRSHASWKPVDRERFASLVASSFGRPLVEDYFERTRPFRVYLSEHYRAAIVLTRENGLAYMDKFAVAEDAKGEGLGRAIWEVMRSENPQLFWRSRRGNAVNEFYFAHADGALKEGPWTTFWYGMPGGREGWKALAGAVAHTATRPATLKDPVADTGS